MSRELVIVGVVLYFATCLFGVLWWFSPSLRTNLHAGVGRALGACRGRPSPWSRQQERGTATGRLALQHGVQQAGSAAGASHTSARWWALSIVLLTGMPALAWLGRQWSVYDGFDHTASRAVNSQVAALLDGEQLVPPPPLPPEMFLTREVQSAKPMVATASRQWELLDSDFRQRLLAVFKLMHEKHNYEMVLIEGYRSPERQAALAALGPTVTHAGAGRSYHQHGLAADCAFLIDGRIVISEQDPRVARGYELYGELAQSLGLVWGGGWRSLKDLGHVELRRAAVMDTLAREEKNEQTLHRDR